MVEVRTGTAALSLPIKNIQSIDEQAARIRTIFPGIGAAEESLADRQLPTSTEG